MQSVDVAIVGGGMVGWRLPAAYRGAAYALPYWSSGTGTSGGGCTTTTARFGYQCASEKLLTRLGVWQDILSRRAVVITVWKCGTKTVLVTFRLRSKHGL